MFFFFLWAKYKRQFSVPFLSCSCSRVDHVCVFLFEQINDDDDDDDDDMAQLMPLSLIVSCFNNIQIGFTFLVPAHPGSPGKRAIKRVCVCVCEVENHAAERHVHYTAGTRLSAALVSDVAAPVQ